MHQKRCVAGQPRTTCESLTERNVPGCYWRVVLDDWCHWCHI